MESKDDPRGRWVLVLGTSIMIFALAFFFKNISSDDIDYVTGSRYSHDGTTFDPESIFFMLLALMTAMHSTYRIVRTRL
jgi:hypothetical protein